MIVTTLNALVAELERQERAAKPLTLDEAINRYWENLFIRCEGCTTEMATKSGRTRSRVYAALKKISADERGE